MYNIIDDYKNHQKVHTDASKSNERISISITFENKIIKYKQSNECSIYSAKTLAILKVIQIFINTDHPKFIILSDSLYVNRIINKTNPSDIIVLVQNKPHEDKNNLKNKL